MKLYQCLKTERFVLGVPRRLEVSGFTLTELLVVLGIIALWDWPQAGHRPLRRNQARPRAPRRKADILFCDGHVEALKLGLLFSDKSDQALSMWNRDHRPHRERLK